jgi:hypothetical protein
LWNTLPVSAIGIHPGIAGFNEFWASDLWFGWPWTFGTLHVLGTARTTSGVMVATIRFVLEERMSPTFVNPDASEGFVVHFFEWEITSN